MKSILIAIALLVSGLAYGQTAEEYFNRAFDKVELEDYRGAIADYTKAIELNPNDENYYISRGKYKTVLEDHIGAIADFTKAIELNPNHADSYFARGLSRIVLSEKTIELNPNYADSYKDEGCMDLSKAGELGYYEAYDMIKAYCN